MQKGSLLAIAALLLSSASATPKFFQILRERAQKLRADTFLGSSFPGGADANQAPVIGVVTQTLETELLEDERFDKYHSYVMHSYVDFLQSAGARVVPLVMNELEDVTLEKLSKLNGVLFPGGDGDYLEYGRFVFEKVKEFNDAGVFYPAWGVCMGYENMMSYVADGGWSVMESYELDYGSLALEFVVDPRDTKMYGQLGDSAFFFEDHEFTYNSHHWSIDPETFQTDEGLKGMFHVTAISYMPEPDGRPIVASVESDQYPFFGTQFHPEKSTQVYVEDSDIDHTWLGIHMNQIFNDYFIYLARHSTNYAGDFSEVQKMVIQNAETIVTDTYYGSVYVFE